jgi:multiple sugar transport system substrate-binding protein
MVSRRTMSRCFRGIAIAAVVACGVAACSTSNSSSGSTSPTSVSSTAKVHLTYALWDPNEEVGYKQSIAVFEQSHPNISVSVVQIPYPDYQEKLQEEFTSGTGPDIFWVNTPWLSTWIQDGLLMNLAPYIAKANIDMSQYIPSLVSLHTYKGAIYGLPKDWDTIAVFYNENYFAEHHIPVPTSWSWSPTNGGSFLHTLELATTDTNGVNATSPNFNPNTVATYGAEVDNSMQTGWGNFLAEDGVQTIPSAFAATTTFSSPQGDQVFQFLRNLMYKYHVMVPGAELGANGTDPSSENNDLFAQGKIAMQIAGDWETTGTYADVGGKFKIGVIPLPSGPDGTWSVFNGLIDGINPHTPNFAAAWELEQWLGSPASEKIMGEGGYIWPAIPTLDPLFAAYWAKKGINMDAFLNESKGNLSNWPNTPGMNQGLTDMQRDMGSIWLGPGTLAQTTSAVAQAASDADHDLSVAASG